MTALGSMNCQTPRTLGSVGTLAVDGAQLSKSDIRTMLWASSAVSEYIYQKTLLEQALVYTGSARWQQDELQPADKDPGGNREE